jgi:hypothetical protein
MFFMDILNNLSKIAKSVGDSAVTVAKKSGEVVEITKLNASISAENDKIKILYEEIGEEVYAKYKQGETVIDAMLGKCEEIQQISQNLDCIKQRILEIKDIKLCPGCGSKIEYSVLFCPMCGEKQPIQAPKPTKEELEEAAEEDGYLFEETGENCEGTECTFNGVNKED